MDKNSKGMTMLGMLIIVVLIVLVIVVVIKIGGKEIEKNSLEDIKTNLLAVQAKAKTILEKNAIDPENEILIGIKLIKHEDQYQPESGEFVLEESLKNVLSENDTEYYIWNEEVLKEKGLANIKTDEEKFYIVDYKNNEIYYSVGYEGIYKLSDLKEM